MSAIPSWAVPGAKVVCVDDSLPVEDLMELHPTFVSSGATYTIRAVRPADECSGPNLLLVEIASAINPAFDVEQGFALCRFRPLITRTQEQDAALFRPLLNPSLDEMAERNRKQGEEIDAQLADLRRSFDAVKLERIAEGIFA